MESKVWVKYKGGIAKIINKAQESFELETGSSLKSLIAMVFRSNRKLSESNSPVKGQTVLVVLNDNFVPPTDYESTTLRAGDIVTLFPMVSGG